MSAFNLGQGVAVKDFAPHLSEEDKKAKAEALAKIISKGKWGAKPVVQAQYARYPTTAKREAKRLAVFNLMIPKELEDLNALLSKACPPDAPEVLIVEHDKHFSDTHNSLTHVVTYYPVSYLQLDTKGFQLLANVN